MKEYFVILKRYRYKLSKQQFRTLKGQILSADYDGFKKGLKNILERKRIVYGI